MKNDGGAVLVGRVVRPQGNRGEVVVAPETDRPEERFNVGAPVTVVHEGRSRTLTVRESRAHDGRWVVGFEGVNTIDDAEALRGAELTIDAEALPALETGRYYLHDLAGCTVETTAGARVGVVEKIDTSVGTTVLVVGAGGREVLVPFAAEICRVVDVAGKRIVIDPPEGLLDL
jgi:16S rRNA processing protein RimM